MGSVLINPPPNCSVRKYLATIEFVLIVLIIIVLLLKFQLIFLLNIDGDEFSFLSIVHQYKEGILSSRFMTFHVHLFSWLPLVSNNEAEQIIAARICMYFLGAGSCILIYLMGRKFFNRCGALFAVLSYVSLSNIIEHGASFRFDPICAFLFLISIYFILERDKFKYSFIISGLSLALSLMITLKASIYMITIAIILSCIVIFERSKMLIFKYVAGFFVALVFGFFSFYIFHDMMLYGKNITETQSYLGNLASNVIVFENLFPVWVYAAISMYDNLFIWILLFGGFIFVLCRIFKERHEKSSQDLLLLSFLVPLLSIIFYVYPYPYFYVFIMSPGILLCGVMIDQVSENYKKSGSLLSFFVIVLASVFLSINFTKHYIRNAFDRTSAQKEIIETVHKIFPDSVPYIDACSMISSYPKIGLFMTSWDMEKYIERKKPIMLNALVKNHPVFLLSNIVSLNLSLTRDEVLKSGYLPLLDEDHSILKNNFIHHWGILYVTGKDIYFGHKNKRQTFEILIPGVYTIEAKGNVRINNIVYPPGSQIEFEKKEYTIDSAETPTRVMIRWGKKLYRPPDNPSSQLVFSGYYWKNVLPNRENWPYQIPKN